MKKPIKKKPANFKRPAKYGPAMIKRLCDLVAEDDYTVAELCHNAGISPDSYYKWKREHEELVTALKEAEMKRLDLYKMEARKSALKKIKGYEVEEIRLVYGRNKKGRQVIKEKTLTKKHYQPDTAMIIFTLKNTDPENFRDKQEISMENKFIEIKEYLSDDINELPGEAGGE